MSKKLKLVKWLGGTLLLTLLTGCIIPYPHTTVRSFEVHGRVLDARTRAPIQGAKVFLSEHPNVRSTTDATGKFRIKATHNFHLGAAVPEADWPPGKYWHSDVTVLHPDYTIYVQRELDDRWLTDKADILLEPKR